MDEYGKTLQLGEKHLYQVVPRLLSVWFDFTSIQDTEDKRKVCSNMDVIADSGKKIHITFKFGNFY